VIKPSGIPRLRAPLPSGTAPARPFPPQPHDPTASKPPTSSSVNSNTTPSAPTPRPCPPPPPHLPPSRRDSRSPRRRLPSTVWRRGRGRDGVVDLVRGMRGGGRGGGGRRRLLRFLRARERRARAKGGEHARLQERRSIRWRCVYSPTDTFRSFDQERKHLTHDQGPDVFPAPRKLSGMQGT
jgi:hypothetical protein